MQKDINTIKDCCEKCWVISNPVNVKCDGDCPCHKKPEEVKIGDDPLRYATGGDLETTTTGTKPQVKEEWEVLASKTALEAHKNVKHYAKFSSIIEKALSQTRREVMDKVKEMVENLGLHSNDCRGHLHDPGCPTILIKAKLKSLTNNQ